MTELRDTDAVHVGRRKIQRWHFGKLIMLWTWGASLVALSLYAVVILPPERFALGTILLLVSLIIPAVLSVITWKWLTGKER